MPIVFYENIFNSPLLPSLDFDSLETIKGKGDIVAYVLQRHITGLGNPAIGSEYECFGEVTSSDAHGCRVKWDNGKNNTYNHSDLVLVKGQKSQNPNFLFVQRKNNKKKVVFAPFLKDL